MNALLLVQIRECWAQISVEEKRAGNAEHAQLAASNARALDELLAKHAPRGRDLEEMIYTNTMCATRIR